jgi:hypothetical protein
MFSEMFNNFFGAASTGGQQSGHFPQHQQRQSNKPSCPPPASQRAIDNLPTVTVTSDDLLEETNKECLICLAVRIEEFMSFFDALFNPRTICLYLSRSKTLGRKHASCHVVIFTIDLVFLTGFTRTALVSASKVV